MDVYLRFITQFIDEDGKLQTGIFKAIDYIENHDLTEKEDRERLSLIHQWFRDNLDAPKWFKNPQYRTYEKRSLSWFKDSAKEHIFNIQESISILEKYNIIVERVAIKNPGKIRFTDKYQISAEPLSDKQKKI